MREFFATLRICRCFAKLNIRSRNVTVKLHKHIKQVKIYSEYFKGMIKFLAIKT